MGDKLSRAALRALLACLTIAVCHPLRAGDLDGAAKVTSLTGQVSVLRDNQPWALSVDDVVQPRQIIVTGSDGFAVFQVADGSTFEVFPNSRVVFRDTPGNWRDLLDILIGRIKVQIQKLNGQPNFNRIRTPTAVISVRGTVFDVNVEDEEATTLIVVEEGQVSVQHALQPPFSAKVLNAGEWIRIFKNQPIALKSVDRGQVLLGVFRAAREAMYQAIYRSPGSRSPGGGPTGNPGGSGDRCKNNDCSSPPPPPASPPPPPPPPTGPH